MDENYIKIKQINCEYVRLIKSYHTKLCECVPEANPSSYQELKDALTANINLKTSIPTKFGITKVSNIEFLFDELRDNINQFWKINSRRLFRSIQKSDINGNAMWLDRDITIDLTKYFLYYDCVYIPDPTPNYLNHWDNLPPHDKISLLDWITIVLDMEQLATCDLDTPLIVFYPQQFSNSNESDIVSNLNDVTENLTLSTLKDVFQVGNQSTSILEIMEEIKGHNCFQQAGLIDYNKLNILVNLFNSPEINLRQFNNISANDLSYKSFKEHRLVNRYCSDDLIWIIKILLSYYYLLLSREHNSSFLKARNTTTPKFFWGYNYRNNLIRQNYMVNNMHDDDFINHTFETGFSWLNNLSIEDCIKIREYGYMNDMRDIFRKKVRVYSELDLDHIDHATAHYENDIKQIIAEESKKLETDFSGIKKRLMLSSASFVVGASLTVGGFMYPPASIVSAILGVGLGTKSIRDIQIEGTNWSNYKKSFNYRPVNLLINQLNNNTNNT